MYHLLLSRPLRSVTMPCCETKLTSYKCLVRVNLIRWLARVNLIRWVARVSLIRRKGPELDWLVLSWFAWTLYAESQISKEPPPNYCPAFAHDPGPPSGPELRARKSEKKLNSTNSPAVYDSCSSEIRKKNPKSGPKFTRKAAPNATECKFCASWKVFKKGRNYRKKSRKRATFCAIGRRWASSKPSVDSSKLVLIHSKFLLKTAGGTG